MNIRKPTNYSAMFKELDALLLAELPQMELYCKIGQLVSSRPEKGAAAAAAEYINKTYPDISGFSPRNLRRMRNFYRTYQDVPEVLVEAMTIGWTQNMVILEADLTLQEKAWYIQAVQEFGWSKPTLLKEMNSKAHSKVSLDSRQEVCYTGENIGIRHQKGQPHMKLDKTKKDWWKSAVFYQIYPKSFQDSNGDGIGDLPGIIQRLDYLERLGVDGIWLSPVYASPQRDNGYDISDYQAIDPRFGTMEDMEELLTAAARRGITIIMDLVLNHTSDRHRWFLEAKSSRDNPYHDYYIWRDGAPDCPPNDMIACFGGSAWTYVPEIGQYYFNQFSPWQPDLNWENPVVRQELCDMIRFWVDKGVGGFRLDVIDNIGKEPDNKITYNGPHLHEYIRELRQKAFRENTLVTVGEAWSSSVGTARLYANPDGSELSMVFQFEHLLVDHRNGEKWASQPLPLVKLKQCYEHWQQGLFSAGWNSLFLENHDLPRIVSRWGDEGRYQVESAKMLAAMCHGMQGTPYIYQGEEIGMTNIRLPIEQYDDLEIKNMYAERITQGVPETEIMEAIYTWGRDNARTPMQWSSGANAGFTNAVPWLPVNPNYTQINAEAALADPDSIFWFYRKLIALRKTYPVFRDGGFTLLEPENTACFAYTRDTAEEHLLVVCNFTAEEQPEICPESFCGAEVLLSNHADPVGPLRPYETRMLYRKA